VDELDDGCGRDVLAPLVAAGPGGQDDAQGPQALAAAADDVLGDLVDQDDVAGQRSTMVWSTSCRSSVTSARISSSCIRATSRPVYIFLDGSHGNRPPPVWECPATPKRLIWRVSPLNFRVFLPGLPAP